MHPLQAIILGIIEGITEFLPVSSTGHLILANTILGIQETEFVKSFDIIIQLGAIAAVGTLFFKDIIKKPIIIAKILVSFLPTALIGFLVYPYVKSILMESPLVITLSLGIGGIILILFEQQQRKSKNTIYAIENIPYAQAFFIGIIQTIAFIPGVSRSATSIIGSMLMGCERSVAVKYSFFLAVPTLIAASGLDILSNYSLLFDPHVRVPLLLGFIFSWITAYIVIQSFMHYVQQKSLSIFGVYRIVIAILFALFYLR